MIKLRSRIYTGKVTHTRLEPVKHGFKYPVYFFAFDLDELAAIDKKVKFFSYNRPGIFSFYDRDYLDPGDVPVREKIYRRLQKEGCAAGVSRIELITCARYFGHVFNPVSFFYCYNEDESLRCVVSQVNNTFGEMHLYVLKDLKKSEQGANLTAEAAKAFHVSPFFDVKGDYEFRFTLPEKSVSIDVNLHKEGRPVLVSRLSGNARPLDSASLLKTMLRYPFDAVLSLPRIHWQAVRLYFQKKLPVFSKPAPSSPMTIRAVKPTAFQKVCFRLMDSALSRLKAGRLQVLLPDKSVKTYGGLESGESAILRVHHYRFFSRVVTASGIGLGEGYMAGDWDSPDVTAFLKLMIDNKPYLSRDTVLSRIGEFVNRRVHRRRRNTETNSRKNIRDHYDLGNDMYELFLDESMTYSCGVYTSEDTTPEEAQQNKLEKIIKKARIRPTDHVLEIGCGWGSFAIKAASETGCRVTGITLSEEQLKMARARVKAAGLEDRIDLKICDYRHMTGTFDRIVSIEMLEAVGHEYLPEFFRTCERLLKPDGIMVLQVITIPDQRYEQYRKSCDWIQKYIFPGGHLPSLKAICDSMTKSSQLMVEELENIGPHYARTLAEWRRAFMMNKEKIMRLGFSPEAVLAWEYYFSYCEAGFARRHLNDIHLVLTRAGNPALDTQRKSLYA